MPVGYERWTDKNKLVVLPKTCRHRDIVQVAYFAWLKQLPVGSTIPRAPRFCVDASQSIDRRPWGPSPKTLTQDGQIYVFALDRVLDPEVRTRVVHVQTACITIVFPISVQGGGFRG